MTAAVIFLWVSCLYTMIRSILWLFWMASPWKRLLVLAVLLLAASSCHRPKEKGENPQ